MPTISTLTVDVESRTSGFSRGLKVATAGLAALTAAAGFAFKEFEDSEKVANQTDAVLKSTGESANVTAKHVSDLADALSKKAGIDDEAIQSGENMILTFKNIANEAGKGNDIFDQTTKAVLDMSVAMGQDMKSSAIQVGKALNDPVAGITALTRVGVTFTEQQKEQIAALVESGNTLKAQKMILAELTSEFGGSAAAQATASGKMQVALGNLAETVGKLLAPAVTFLADKLLDLVGFMQDNVGPAFKAAGEWLSSVWDRIKPLAEIIGGALVDAWHALVGAVNRLLPDLKKLWDALQPILKVVGEVIGIVLILAAKLLGPVITAIGFVLDILVKWWTFLAQTADKIGEFVGKVIDWFGRVKDGVVKAWDSTLEFLKSIPGRILGFFADAGQWLYEAGRAVLTGFWHGLLSVWESVKNFFGGIGSWISDHKGPVQRDRKLLVKHGQAIMAGFQQGLDQGFQGVQSSVSGMGAALSVSGAAVGAAGVSGDVVLQVDGQTFARIARDQLLKLSKRNAGTGL